MEELACTPGVREVKREDAGMAITLRQIHGPNACGFATPSNLPVAVGGVFEYSTPIARGQRNRLSTPG